MSDRDVLFEAISLLCKASFTSLQGPKRVARSSSNFVINDFISAVMGRSPLQSAVIDEEEFFDPEFDFDFTDLKDTEKYYRGGEVYQRPCGWKRYALKVLDKYPGNTWLGTTYRSTQSCPGEWPVSYHGTSMTGADGIIRDHYEPGSRQIHGRGIYSTPDLCVADHYAKTFISTKNRKTYKVVLQNRINPEYREKYVNDLYWLVPIPEGKSAKEMVERAIRPYGLLLKEV